MFNLEPIQQFMRDHSIDAWLVHDFRGNNSVFAQLLPGKRFTTRRIELIIPASGEPVLLANPLDAAQFGRDGVTVQQYFAWEQLHALLKEKLKNAKRIAMEYSARCELPVVSIIDAGTIELVRSFGIEIVSSADLIQVSVARWSELARRNHDRASGMVADIKDRAFELIGHRIRTEQAVDEYFVQQFIMNEFATAGLETPDPPIVAVNAHSGDPHFEISKSNPSPIQRGDFVLIDLWARVPGDENIFSDITWVGCVGEPSAMQLEVFDVVRRARDAAVEAAREPGVQGWQLDDAARKQIIDAGYGNFIKHRTGHSLSPGPMVHGIGVNLDNLETHDARAVLSGIGFTIEPGVYLPEFGVRLEINVFMDPLKGPVITSCLQREIVKITI